MECTQVLLSESFEEVNSTNEKLPVATLEIEGVFYTIYNSENVIGRDDSCHIIIKNNAISSKHAIIEAEDPSAHLLYDLGSTNKTKLGKITLKPQVRYHIHDGDVVTFGNISGLYNVSRQSANTPKKVKPLSVPETPERDQLASSIVSESSDEKKNNESLLETSDMDMFDENECDTSTIQQDVVGSSAEPLKKNDDIYEMDTIQFDSNEIFPKNEDNYKGSADASGKPSTSDENDTSSRKNGDKAENNESIYEICTQSSGVEDDKLDVCDSTMKGTDNDKNNMEVSSSVEDEKGNEEINDDDTNVYGINTQNPFVDETQLSKSDSLFEKDKSNNYGWEDFPDIASPVGLDTSNADDLDCPSTSKLEAKNSSDNSMEVEENRAVKISDCKDSYNFTEAATRHVEDCKDQDISVEESNAEEEAHEKTVSNTLQKDKDDIVSEKERPPPDEVNCLPASQNIDMFESFNNLKDSCEKNKTCDNLISNFNESDDESMSQLADELFPVKDDASCKNIGVVRKDMSSSFLFEPSTQPTNAEELLEDSSATAKVDETLSSSFFEAETQPVIPNNDSEIFKAVNNPSVSVSDNILETARHSAAKNNDDIFKAGTPPVKENKDIFAPDTASTIINNDNDLFEIATQPVKPSNDNDIFEVAAQPSLTNSDNDIHEVATQPVKPNNVNEIFELATQPSLMNSDNEIFEAATQPVKTSNDEIFEAALPTKNDNDIHEAATQLVKPNNDNDIFEVATQPSLMNSDNGIFEAATQPVKTSNDNNIFEAASLTKNNIFEADTQPSLTNNDNEIFEAAAEPVKPRNDNDISEADTQPSLTSNDNEIFEAETQPVKADFHILSSGGSSMAKDSSEMGSSAARKELKEATRAFLISEESRILDEKVCSDSCKVTRAKESSIDSCRKLKNDSKVVLENELDGSKNGVTLVNESFFEAATQPVSTQHVFVKDMPEDKDQSNLCKISDRGVTSLTIPSEIFNVDDSSKPFPDDLVMSQSFYEAATQPFIQTDPISKQTEKGDEIMPSGDESLKILSVEESNTTILNRHDLTNSLSDSFHNLNTQPLQLREIDDISLNEIKLESKENIDKIERKENDGLKDDIISNNDASNTENFYELATQPSTNTDISSNVLKLTHINKIADHDVNVENSTSDIRNVDEFDSKLSSTKNDSPLHLSISISDGSNKKYIDINSIGANKNFSSNPPEEENYTESFYELATQPVVGRDELLSPGSSAEKKELFQEPPNNVVGSTSSETVLPAGLTESVPAENERLSESAKSKSTNQSKVSGLGEIKVSETLRNREKNPIDPLCDFIQAPDPELDVREEHFYEAATQPFPGDDIKQNIDEITAVLADKSDCRTVLMELSESIFPMATQGPSKDKVDKIMDSKISLDKTVSESYKMKVVNDTTSNKTIRDDIDMSISCANLYDILQGKAPENDSHTLKLSSKIINNEKVSESLKHIEDPDLQTTQDLLKILEGDDESIVEGELLEENNFNDNKYKEEPPNSGVCELPDQALDNSGRMSIKETSAIALPEKSADVSHSTKKMKTDSIRESTITPKKKETSINSNESSQEISPLVTRRRTRRLNISDESEQSSEEFVFRFNKKGCNVFPPDSEDLFSSEKESILPGNDKTSDARPSSASESVKSRSQCQKEMKKIKNNLNYPQEAENILRNESQQSSEELIIKFKKKNTNVFPPDSEPFLYNKESDKSEINDELPVVKEGSEKETPSKRTKSSIERDQSYISRGNITLHSQEVLEELEEQFRLTAVAMSPTQLSVASESDDEISTDIKDSPIIRRSERKRSEKVVYKPLVNKNNKDNMSVDHKKVAGSKGKKISGGQDNLSPMKQSKGNSSNGTSVSDEKKKSVKTFKKATPTKEHQLNCDEESINNNSKPEKDTILDSIKKEPLDYSDSQSSLSNLENSENEFGRGKRKRVRTSFDGFILDEDFKKNRKKSSSPMLTPESQPMKLVNRDVKIEKPASAGTELSQTPNMIQTLCVVLHDINKKPLYSGSTLKLESSKEETKQNSSSQADNDEDDLILPPKKTNFNKSKTVVSKEISKTDEKNTTASVSSSKANTTSFCDKLDELFNIWGPADRVKLSPRAPKKTYKILQNEKNSTRKQSDENSNQHNDNQKSKEKEKSKIPTKIVSSKSKKPNLRGSTQSETSNSQESNNGKPGPNRKLPLKHKITDRSSNEPVEKRVRKTRSSSQSESIKSSEIQASPVSSSVRRKSNRSDSSSTKSDEKRKRPAMKSLNSDDNQASSSTTRKKTRIDSKNNSQDIINDSPEVPSPISENTSPNNNSNSKPAKTSKSNSKRINQKVPLKNNNNIKNSKQINTSPVSNHHREDHYIMSQEFSFRTRRSNSEKSPIKEEFKLPEIKVRRSARSKIAENKTDTEKVMFTGLSDKKLSALVTKLGGEVVDSPFTCTVLITDKVRRTAKFLSALSRGVPIVSPAWLANSSGGFADINKFIVNDPVAEKTYSFSLKKSLQKARTNKLLDGWSIYVTPSVNPPLDDMKSVIECSGGKCLVREPARWPPNSLIISCEEDREKWSSLIRRGKRPPIVETEALFSGILQQNLNIEQYRLH